MLDAPVASSLLPAPLLASPPGGAALAHQASIGAEVRLLRRAGRAGWNALTAGLFVAPVAVAAVAAR